jgi:hypothetical protein
MELLLNLMWLLLMVPAYLLWRDSRRHPQAHRSSLVLLVLACTLAILFPVVSASDDIQAMRPEMEEAASRDAITSSHQTRLQHSVQHSTGGVALLASLLARHAEAHALSTVAPLLCHVPACISLESLSARAPPVAPFS